jgi:hypothetical protein
MGTEVTAWTNSCIEDRVIVLVSPGKGAFAGFERWVKGNQDGAVLGLGDVLQVVHSVYRDVSEGRH